MSDERRPCHACHVSRLPPQLPPLGRATESPSLVSDRLSCAHAIANASIGSQPLPTPSGSVRALHHHHYTPPLPASPFPPRRNEVKWAGTRTSQRELCSPASPSTTTTLRHRPPRPSLPHSDPPLPDAMKFNGPAPELINGRLAMVGLLTGRGRDWCLGEGAARHGGLLTYWGWVWCLGEGAARCVGPPHR